MTLPASIEQPVTGGDRARLFLLVLVPLFALYLATARTDLPYHIDAATNVFSAWTLGTTGSPILEDYAELAQPEHLSVFAWVVPSEQGPVSQYPPGTALLAAPLYAIWSDATPVSLSASNADADARVTLPIPSLRPAAIVSSLTTAAAFGFIALTVLEAGFTFRSAAATAFIGATGTSAWTVAADQLWQHGPGMLWVSLGVYLAVRERWLGSGLAWSAQVLTRPPVVLIGVVFGLWLILRRRWNDAGMLLLGALPGSLALLLYNWWLFGSASISGGYGSLFAARLTGGPPDGYLANIGSALFDGGHGLFVWSPFLLLALVHIPQATKSVPRWAVVAAAGGLAYLLVQLRMNRASGGEGFAFYRYPLEPLAAAATLLAASFRRAWTTGPLLRLVAISTVAFGLVAHGVWA